MQRQRVSKFDLKAMANRLMLDHGFVVDEPPPVREAVAKIEGDGNLAKTPAYKDLRALLWSSIDNTESRDLDQIEYVERRQNGGYRLLVGIADVDHFVPQNSPLDQFAYTNSTSVYTGVETFPMLPEELSTNRSSLISSAEREALIIDIEIDDGGHVTEGNVYLGLVENKAKLAYETVGDWLDGGDWAVHGSSRSLLQTVPGLEEQLRLQEELAKKLQETHQKLGALGVQTIEAHTIAVDGVVIDLQITQQNKARDIIQIFMVTANGVIARFVSDHNAPSIQRIVRKPEKWTRLIALARRYDYALSETPDALALAKFVADRKAKDPEHFPDLSLSVVKLLGPGQYVVHVPGQPSEGHFSLAVHDYTHATAPNRRYVDLVIQRIIKAFLNSGHAPYTVEQLEEIAQHCEDREQAARQVERTMRKAAAAVLLSKHIGETYRAIVTGVNAKGTFARLIKPPAEGMVVQNQHGLEIGDKISVKLLAADPARGFIDFARLNA